MVMLFLEKVWKAVSFFSKSKGYAVII